MESSRDDTELSHHGFWLEVQRRLGVVVVAPFEFEFEGRKHTDLVYLPDFGGPKGMVIGALQWSIDNELMEDAESAGFYCSLVTYNEYDEAEAKDALADWGYSGDAASCPPWFESARNE